MRPIVFVLLSVFVGLQSVFAQTAQTPIIEDFETYSIDKPPSAPWVCHMPEGEPSIRITDTKFASGKKCLAISCNVPMEVRHKVPLPRLERPIHDTGLTGTLIFEGNILFAPSTDTRIVIALTGGPKGQKVVSLLNSMSRLRSGERLVWNPVLPDRWYQFKFIIYKETVTADLEVGERGATWRNKFYSIPLGKPEEIFPLKSISIYFGGPAKKGVCAYFDELKVATSERSANAKEQPSVPPSPWWRNYHNVVSHPRQVKGKEWELGMMCERSAWATGWYGAWWVQNQVERRGLYDALKHVEYYRSIGVKNVFYFDAGEFGEFVALVDDGRIVRTQWELCFYRGEKGRLMWFGMDGFYSDQNPLRLKNYRDFGLPAWTLPDGKRVKCVYDLAVTSFEGKRDAWDYSKVRPSDEIAKALNLDAFLRTGSDPVPPEVGRSLGRIVTYDHSNPFLLEDFKTNVRMMLAFKPAFIHFDNYFDNETLYPYWHGFGPWSLESLKRFVKANVPEATRRAIGIEDIERFDLKKYILEKPLESRGHRWHFSNPAWRDDPIWNLYICAKWHDSRELFTRLYQFCKAESRRHGAEVVVAGNTIPIFPGGSLVTGAIDLPHFEHTIHRQYGPVKIPTGLPPLGRLGGVARLGAAVSATGYCWLSAYVPQDLSGPGHENLHKVLAADCLANKGVLDYGHQYREGYSPGSPESAGWINCFIKNFSAYYGSRTALADVGLVYPGETVMGSISVFTMDPTYCLYDYLGWAQALTDFHFQWDVVTDDQLKPENLKRFKVLVLPSAACLSDEALSALRGFVQAGGRIIASGPAGTRFGVAGFLWKRNQPPAFSGPVLGRRYYEDIKDGERSDGGALICEAVKSALQGTTPIVETDAPKTVGVFAFAEAGGSLALDLVNYQVEPQTDKLTPVKEFKVIVCAPVGCRFVNSAPTMISPDLRSRIPGATPQTSPTPWQYHRKTLSQFSLKNDGRLEIIVPPFGVFATVSITTEAESDAK